MATLGFEPPITPGLMLPVSWYLQHYADDEGEDDEGDDDEDDDDKDYDCDNIVMITYDLILSQ